LLLSICAFLFTSVVRSEDIQLFIVTHSHDDVGWIVPWEEYYKNQVHSILDSMVVALTDKPYRKYTQVEIAFFKKWWDGATDDQKNKIKLFVQNGQLEFNLGGITMNDESCPTYYEEINQMTDGAKWLFDTIGARPNSAWHIDPFGHSKATASLWSQMGFNGFGLNRIPTTTKDNMKATQGLEFVWRGSDSLGQSSEIFAHVMDSHYSTPSEINFSNGWDVETVAKDTVKMAKLRKTWYSHNNLLIPFGDDFTHTDAPRDFDNMDKLMDYVNKNDMGIKMRYAFVSDYINAVNNLNKTWSVYKGDFFPYMDGDHSYWSGYYSSKPAFKTYLRQSDSHLQSSEMLLAAALMSKSVSQEDINSIDKHINTLRFATSVGTHHDAVSGTETTSTSAAYQTQLDEGNQENLKAVRELSVKLLNVTSTSSQDVQYLMVTNPLGWPRKQVITVSSDRSGAVVSHGNTVVPSQVNPAPSYGQDNGKYRLYFLASLPAFSSTIYNVKYNDDAATKKVANNGLDNGQVQVNFDSNGKVSALKNSKNGKQSELSLDYRQYVSQVTGQNSGAYILRPDDPSYVNIGTSADNFKDISLNFREGVFQNKPFVFASVYVAENSDGVTVTPHADSNNDVKLMVTRLDKSEGWGASYQADLAAFEKFPLNLNGVGWSMGRSDISASQDSQSTVTVQFSSAMSGVKAFNSAPVVILSVSTTGSPQPNLYTLTASLQNVDKQSFTAVIKHVRSAQGWSADDKLQLEWFAVESGSHDNGVHSVRAGKYKVSKSADPTKIQVDFQTSFTEPLVLLTAESSVKNQAYNLNLRSRGPASFTSVLTRVDTDSQIRDDDVYVHYVVLPRFPYVVDVKQQVDSVKYDGALVEEVQLDFGTGFGQTIVQYKLDGLFGSFTQVTNEIGPMPIASRELFLHVSTSLQTGAQIFTDDNGLEIVKRENTFDTKEIVPANYFPMVQRVYVQDVNQDLQLDFFSDSTHGAAALASGQLEMMMNRRCGGDDGRGVGQVLNDPSPLKTDIWVTLSGKSDGISLSRQLSLFQQFPPTVVVVDGPGRDFDLSGNLPNNVHLLTLRNFGNNRVLARFQHIYAAKEHPTLSKPVKINLKGVFGGLSSATIVEYNLNAHTPLSQINKLKWNTNDNNGDFKPIPVTSDGVLVLQPMEIRTIVYHL